jgi:hypothetical protein
MTVQLKPMPAPPPPTRARPRLEDLEQMRCSSCGDAYPVPEGPAMLFALKSHCPRCGGEFELDVH